MSSLNLSTNGPSINRSYQSVVSAAGPTGPAASSPTYGIWALFSVSAPLANAFAQKSTGGESVLKVQSTGEGELIDLVDEFSDGKIQFAFAKVKDPNTTLFKNVLIAWCGEGVPERTKGYFTSHLTAVAKTLHGYHVQITARSERDLTPQSIVQKVADASGSKYSGTTANPAGPAPPIASKPVFTSVQSSTGIGSFNPLAARARQTKPSGQVDEDGWGEDAPPVTRTQLEKVSPSYQPTKVGLHGLASPSSGDSGSVAPSHPAIPQDPNLIRGGYQPIGKVNIAEIRRQAQKESKDDRPTPVKGAYEPVGKVDIAAIRARAQQPTADVKPDAFNETTSAADEDSYSSLSNRMQSLDTSERLVSLPKPKVANKFGTGASNFAGTKPPAPAGTGSSAKAPLQTGVGRTFADQGGRTPAQIWAEKKAKSGSNSFAETASPAQGIEQSSGTGGGWKSGYTGKSWAAVQTTRTGRSNSGSAEQSSEPETRGESDPPIGGLGAIRDRFNTTTPMGVPPALDISNKPNATKGALEAGAFPQTSRNEDVHEQMPAMPTPPPQPPRSPTPPTPPAVSGSPIRVAMPVGRSEGPPQVTDARDELTSPPPMPTESLASVIPPTQTLSDESSSHHAARGAAEAMATSTAGEHAVEMTQLGATDSGHRALVSYDYEKAEPNELELQEGETIFNIEMVDENWWMGQNSKGETGLFPSNYVELSQETDHPQTENTPTASDPPSAAAGAQPVSHGRTATALYDYEAAEGNELSFPEDAKITDIEFPDEDWWSGSYRGREGLFPANYVKLDE